MASLGQLKHKLQVLRDLKSAHRDDQYVINQVEELIEDTVHSIHQEEEIRAAKIIIDALKEKGLENT